MFALEYNHSSYILHYVPLLNIISENNACITRYIPVFIFLVFKNGTARIM